MEKQIHVCEKCGRVRFATRDELRTEGWKFIMGTNCPDCRPKVKRNDCYKMDECFTHNWYTGEETGR